jgi:hypothetical protein
MADVTTDALASLPRYRCYKIVRAGKIVAIELEGDLGTMAPFYACELEGGLRVSLSDKHHPQIGGYVVRYEDGYTSYSPAKAFEEGYTKIVEPTR